MEAFVNVFVFQRVCHAVRRVCISHFRRELLFDLFRAVPIQASVFVVYLVLGPFMNLRLEDRGKNPPACFLRLT